MEEQEFDGEICSVVGGTGGAYAGVCDKGEGQGKGVGEGDCECACRLFFAYVLVCVFACLLVACG